MSLIQKPNQRKADDHIANGSATPPPEGTTQYTYPRTSMGEPRPVRIVVIGAGVSGIAAVKMFKDRFKDKHTELVLYERNADVGGTWLENRYPG